MSSISLKIRILDLNFVKTFQFNGSMTVDEVSHEIRERVGEHAGGGDHSLFWADCATGPKWLGGGRTLDYYDLKSGDILEFKKKHRVLKVKMLDGSVKTVWIDESLTVSQLVQVACEKLGVSNPEEYSFQPDDYSAGYIKDRKRTKSNDAVSGDAKWLNPDKSLPEQGITENDMVVLKKKFFYSDVNIDRNDPVQLNLLYVQSRDAILTGKYPVTATEAAQFGAIQLQVQHGNNEPDKHKPGFVKVEEYLPPDYYKTKEVEKLMYYQHRKLQGMTELNAKYRYIQLCRSLKTYGVSFFLVKEQSNKKNKLVNVLLGITKDSVVRLDAETKEIIKSWPLKQLRRWAASPNSFTLDFGDYADEYYSVQTTEGEQISFIIAGYIDIIMKKKKEAEKASVDEVSIASVEEYSKQGKFARIGGQSGAAGAQAKRGVIESIAQKRGVVELSRYSVQQLAQYSPGQQAILQNIQGGYAAINHALMDMNVPTQLPPIGNDAQSIAWKRNTVTVSSETVTNQMYAQLAAIASIVSQSAQGSAMDMDVVGANIATITSNMGQLSSSTKLLSALEATESSQQAILEAARNVARNTTKFLAAAEPVLMDGEGLQDMFNAALETSGAVDNLFTQLGRQDASDEAKARVITYAVGIAEAVKGLTVATKMVAGHFRNPKQQTDMIDESKRCSRVSDHTVIAAKVIAPAYTSATCSDVALQATITLRDGVAALTEMSSSCPNDQAYRQMKEAAARVNDAIAKLVNSLTSAEDSAEGAGNIKAQREMLYNSAMSVLKNLDNPEALVSSTKNTTFAATQLVNTLRAASENESLDLAKRNRMSQASIALADSVQVMVSSVREYAKAPDERKRLTVDRFVRGVLSAADSAVAGGVSQNEQCVRALAKSAKTNIETITQLVSAATAASPHNRNATSQSQLSQISRQSTQACARLITAVHEYNASPQNAKAIMELLVASKAILSPTTVLVANAKAAAPTVNDFASQNQLINAANTQYEELRSLQAAVETVESTQPELPVTGSIQRVEETLEAVKAARSQYKYLRPTASQTYNSCEAEIISLSQVCGTVAAQIVAAFNKNDLKHLTLTTGDLSAILTNIAEASKGLSSLADDENVRTGALDRTIDVLESSKGMMALVLDKLKNPASVDAVKSQEALKRVTNNLSQLTRVIPGQRKADEVIRGILDKAQAFKPVSIKGGDYAVAKSKIVGAAGALASSLNDVVQAARGTSPSAFQESLNAFDSAFTRLVDSAQILAAANDDSQYRAQVGQAVQRIAESSVKTLTIAQACMNDQLDMAKRNELVTTSQFVTRSINGLLENVTTKVPGHGDCDNALQQLDRVLLQLNNTNEGFVIQENLSMSVAKANESAKAVTDSLGTLSADIRAANGDRIAANVSNIANLVSKMAKHVSYSAYLIGLSAPGSVPPGRGLIPGSVVTAAGDLQVMILNVGKSNQPREKVLSDIQKPAGHISQELKSARQNATDPELNRIVNKLANDYESSLQPCIQVVQKEAQDPSIAAHPALQRLHSQLEAVKAAAKDNRFKGAPAYISPAGQASQKPIVEVCRQTVINCMDVVNTAKLLLSDLNDASYSKMLLNQGKCLADALRSLSSQLDNGVPGQKELNDMLQQIANYAGEIDAAILNSTVGNLRPSQKNEQWYSEGLRESSKELLPILDRVVSACKAKPQLLAEAITALTPVFASMSSYAIGLAGTTNDTAVQEDILNSARKLASAISDFVLNCKSVVGGNNPSVISKVEESRAQIKNAVRVMIEEAANVCGQDDVIAQVVSDMENKLGTFGSAAKSLPADSHYIIYGNAIDSVSKQMMALVKEVVNNSKTPDLYDETAIKFADAFNALIDAGEGALATAKDEPLKKNVRITVIDTCKSTIQLLNTLRSKSTDASSRMELSAKVRELSASLAAMMRAARDGMKGVHEIEEAMESIKEVIVDLDATNIFAQAGQLEPLEPSGENFNKYSEAIKSSVQSLLDSCKGINQAALSQSAASLQDTLAQAARSISSQIHIAKERLKAGATGLTSNEKNMQVQVISSGKTLSTTLLNFLSAASSVVTNSKDNSFRTPLNTTFSNFTESTENLLKIVKLLSDESQRGARAIEAAMSAMDDIVQALQSNEPAYGTATVEDVATLAKQLNLACAAVITAAGGSSKDELIASAFALRKLVEDLSRCARIVSEQAPAEQQADLLDSVVSAANVVKKILGAAKSHMTVSSPSNSLSTMKGTLGVSVKELGRKVQELVASANKLTSVVAADDPNALAEQDLITAANLIDQAALKLKEVDPDSNVVGGDAVAATFDSVIHGAAKAIIAAVSNLIRSATSAQREISSLSRRASSGNTIYAYFKDGTWSEGLVSASKQVAIAVGDFCDTANQAVIGAREKKDTSSTYERLAATAKNVSATTSALIMAAVTKTDGNSSSVVRVKAAGKSVMVATDHLVKSVEEHIMTKQDTVDLGKLMTGGVTSQIATEMQTQMDIIRMEHELEKARRKLAEVRKIKYSNGKSSANEESSYTTESKPNVVNSLKSSQSRTGSVNDLNSPPRSRTDSRTNSAQNLQGV